MSERLLEAADRTRDKGLVTEKEHRALKEDLA